MIQRYAFRLRAEQSETYLGFILKNTISCFLLCNRHRLICYVFFKLKRDKRRICPTEKETLKKYFLAIFSIAKYHFYFLSKLSHD